jgi:hypothetical protein
MYCEVTFTGMGMEQLMRTSIQHFYRHFEMNLICAEHNFSHQITD